MVRRATPARAFIIIFSSRQSFIDLAIIFHINIYLINVCLYFTGREDGCQGSRPYIRHNSTQDERALTSFLEGDMQAKSGQKAQIYNQETREHGQDKCEE